MLITDKHIDNGRSFDWGRTSADYAKFRDIYPPEFYERIAKSDLCVKGQRVLDLGTGTGVLPRNMLHFGAKWVGTDISENQIAMARKLSKGTDIEYIVSPSESLNLSDGSFDVITACQCFWYFDHETIMPRLRNMLKPDGKIYLHISYKNAGVGSSFSGIDRINYRVDERNMHFKFSVMPFLKKEEV